MEKIFWNFFHSNEVERDLKSLRENIRTYEGNIENYRNKKKGLDEKVKSLEMIINRLNNTIKAKEKDIEGFLYESEINIGYHV